jgi:hypothetical protein
MPARPGLRGKQIHGQYFEASPGHAAELDATLDDTTKTRWRQLYAVDNAERFKTRGEWIRAAWHRQESHRMRTEGGAR